MSTTNAEVSIDSDRPWYHGSPLELTILRVGSTVTQRRDLARVFSHKPAMVCIENDGRLRHTGKLPGYLYEIAEPVGPEDVVPHPRTTMGPGDEWLIARELRVRLVEATAVRTEETLSEDDILAYRSDGDEASGGSSCGRRS